MLATVVNSPRRGRRRRLRAWLTAEIASQLQAPDRGLLYVAGYELLVAHAGGSVSARFARRAMRALLNAHAMGRYLLVVPFDGVIDEEAVFDRALSDDEIHRLYLKDVG